VICNSGAHYSISLQFGTEFDHVMCYKHSMSNVKGQVYSVIAKLLLLFRKSASMNVMAMSEFWSEAGKYQFVRIRLRIIKWLKRS